MHAPDLEFYLYFFRMEGRGRAFIVSHETRHSSTRLGKTLRPTCEVPERRLASDISGGIMRFSTSVRLPFNKGYVNLPASHCRGSRASALPGSAAVAKSLWRPPPPVITLLCTVCRSQ